MVGHREAIADNLRFAFLKGAVQEQGAVRQMNPIRFRWKILDQCRQFHQLHNVADFAGDVADGAALQFLKDFSPQG